MTSASKLDKKKVILFVFSFVCLGAFINKSDMFHYNLFHAEVAAIVEKGTFQIREHEHPRLDYAGGGDAFEYRGGRFAAKQPGAMLLGAVPYFFLHKAGIRYADDYYNTAALVSFLTTSLYAALAITLLFSLLSLSLNTISALIIAIIFGFGTNFFAYSSNLHHDATATAFLVFSFYLIEKSLFQEKTLDRPLLILAGFCLGFVPFISMLPSFVVLSLFLYALSSGNKHRLAFFTGGVALGALPLLAFNTYYFGAPWIQANIAGGYENTFFDFSLDTIRRNAYLYFGTGAISALWFMPIYYLGLVGLFFVPSKRQRFFLLLACVLHFIYLLNIESFGHCQYGARFLLPTLPFVVWGLTGMWNTSAPAVRISLRVAILAVGFYGIVINLFGAWMGTMHCQIQYFPITTYLENPAWLQKPEFPLWEMLRSRF